MNAQQLVAELERLDKQGIWLLPIATLRVLFHNESEISLKRSLKRHCTNGLLVKVAKGLYANDRARAKPTYALEAVSHLLRPLDFNYLSLESRLSELGMLSQIPNRLSFMTTGRSQTFETPYGVIEFTHTSRNKEELQKKVLFDTERGIYVATSRKAFVDLKRVGRNVDLVDTSQLMT